MGTRAVSGLRDGTNKKFTIGDPDKSRFRIYLQWGGRETGEGKIQLDPDNGNVGYIDFLDTACTRFEGQAELSSFRPAVRFSGHKVNDDSGRQGPVDWSEYSYKTWVFGKTGEWHQNGVIL